MFKKIKQMIHEHKVKKYAEERKIDIELIYYFYSKYKKRIVTVIGNFGEYEVYYRCNNINHKDIVTQDNGNFHINEVY